MTVEEMLTPEEMAELQKYVGAANAPMPEEKYNKFKFVHDVSESDDTTKSGFVTAEELGTPKHPIRTHKNLALVSNFIMDNPYFAQYFNNESEVVTSTSLSKEAMLLKLATFERRQLEDVTKKQKKKGGFFKKKDEGDTE